MDTSKSTTNIHESMSIVNKTSVPEIEPNKSESPKPEAETGEVPTAGIQSVSQSPPKKAMGDSGAGPGVMPLVPVKKYPLYFQPRLRPGESPIMITPTVRTKRTQKEMDDFVKKTIMSDFDAVHELLRICIKESLGKPKYKLIKECVCGPDKSIRMNCLVGNLLETAERGTVEQAKQLVSHQMLLALALVLKIKLPDSLGINQRRKRDDEGFVEGHNIEPRQSSKKSTNVKEVNVIPKKDVPCCNSDKPYVRKHLWDLPEGMKMRARESIRQNDSMKSLANNCECLKLSEPVYTFAKKVRTPDGVTYTYSCQVNKLKSTGFGGTKKQAKQMAAERMFQTLSQSKGILTDAQAELMSTLQVVSTTTNFLTKVLEHPMRPINQPNDENKCGRSSPEDDEEGAKFSLKGIWTRQQLAKLQSLQKPFEEPVELLAEFALKLGFHVTYDNSHSTPSLPIVTVKLSTTPECLLMGQGANAMNDAATAAILCLQVMTEN